MKTTKIRFIVLVLFILFQNSYAQQSTQKETDVELDGLKSNVKQVKQEMYAATIENDVLVQGARVFSSDENYLIKYDINMNRTERKQCSYDGRLLPDVIYEYNGGGKLFKESHFQQDSSLFYRLTYKYDTMGNMIEVEFLNDNLNTNVYKLKYDGKGNMIKGDNYKVDGDLSYFTYKYDNNANKIEEKGYGSNGRLVTSYTYKYDSKGKDRKSTRLNSSHIQKSRMPSSA